MDIQENVSDPYFNLAAEEYIIDNIHEPVFRLWRNAPSVIVGRNQNTPAEVNREYTEANSIAVVRRLTGGGAVYHDPGNINFTFTCDARKGESATEIFRRVTLPIVDALRGLGLDARLDGRNDILIGDAKISGNAMCIRDGRILQHGTLLFDVDMTRLSQALIPRPEKYSGRGVKSVRSRVTNIAECLCSKMDVNEFMEYLTGRICRTAPRGFTPQERIAIEEIAASRYRLDSWNWAGAAATGTVRRLSCGLVELSYSVRDGRLADVAISGDYFFRRGSDEFCALLEGCPYDKKAVTDLLESVTVDDWLCGATAEEIAGMLFT